MSHTVRVLRAAQRDLQAIYDYLILEAPPRAGPFIDRLLEAIESLAEMPARGALPRDPIVRQRGDRMLVHGQF